MFTRQLRMLARYTAWADLRLFKTISELADASCQGRTEAKLIEMTKTLNHSYVVDQIWRAHLQGTEHGFTSRNTDQPPPVSELAMAQSALDQWYIDYADNLSEPQADETVHFRFVDGGKGEMSRGNILLHVVNHKTYHRGYVADMLYRAALRPPTMDLPVFLRDVSDQPAVPT